MTNDGPDADVWSTFCDTAGRIVWATVSTVGAGGVPRSRVLHPLWSDTGQTCQGWVLTRATPLKLDHVARHPYVSVSYWHPDHSTATAECRAAWGSALDVDRAWQRALDLPAPYGYDPSAIWPQGPGGGGSADCAVLVLTPWLIRAASADQLRCGQPATWISADRPAASHRDGAVGHRVPA